jgi:hypothetical protein
MYVITGLMPLDPLKQCEIQLISRFETHPKLKNSGLGGEGASRSGYVYVVVRYKPGQAPWLPPYAFVPGGGGGGDASSADTAGAGGAGAGAGGAGGANSGAGAGAKGKPRWRKGRQASCRGCGCIDAACQKAEGRCWRSQEAWSASR